MTETSNVYSIHPDTSGLYEWEIRKRCFVQTALRLVKVEWVVIARTDDRSTFWAHVRRHEELEWARATKGLHLVGLPYESARIQAPAA